jgi:hypothetical protein
MRSLALVLSAGFCLLSASLAHAQSRVGACCLPDDTCQDLSESDCYAVPPLDLKRTWDGLSVCGEFRCPFGACLNAGSGDYCAVSRPAPGCGLSGCCDEVCLGDPYCCEIQWDTVCVRLADEECLSLPPNNDCGGVNSPALEIVPGGGAVVSMRLATAGPLDPPLCDLRGFRPVCADGPNENYGCCLDDQCPQSVCDVRAPAPAGWPLETLWFKFVATDVSARIHTCGSDPTAADTILGVYRPADPSTPQTSCASLVAIQCNDDAVSCGNGVSSDLCVFTLVPGQTYYVQAAAKSSCGQRGALELAIDSPCGATSPLADFPLPIDPPSEQPPSDGGIDEFTEMLRSTQPQEGSGVFRQGKFIDPRPSTTGSPMDHHEVPRDPWMPRRDTPVAGSPHRGPWIRDGHASIQVNVDAQGSNIVGDAANEPSIAVDPTNPNRIVIGWRQFDTVLSDFRQAGWGYSHDGGATWVFPGVLEEGVFRSDPVLSVDSAGTFYYYSLRFLDDGYPCDMFQSVDGGVSWGAPTYAFGGDKAWMTIDGTVGPGAGHIYAYWTHYYSCCDGSFTRSTDGGVTYETPLSVLNQLHWGTLAVAPDGPLYASGAGGRIGKSTNADDNGMATSFDWLTSVDMGGFGGIYGGEPNPDGLLGQNWVATARPGGPYPHDVYMLETTRTSIDPGDITFVRSGDGGATWGAPVRVNDDALGNGAWQWFGTMSVAPNGRIDAVWNDTRNTPAANLSELFYAYSWDRGATWSANVPVSPEFDSHIGWPNQNKLGDYYHTWSDAKGVNIAYAATFNGEQDVYFLRIEPFTDCNNNGALDQDETEDKGTVDCNRNYVPDECEPNFDSDDLIDECDADMDDDGVENETDACKRNNLQAIVGVDGRPRADTNQDCGIDLNDYWRFRNCMLGGRRGTPAPIGVCRAMFDADGTDSLDLIDYARLQNAFGPLAP